MITNKDLEIQNISYTNKDFGQIYPELIDLVKNITDKWDPEATNESDPGIVLLKVAAFLGDKLNYNIDKNTLEQFITSATQETSMRRLTSMLGYNMKYYNSATTRVSFRYLGDLGVTTQDSKDVLAPYNAFYIKAFDTKFETDDNITYTLLEDIQILKDNKFSYNKLAIQGELKDLSVIGTDNYSNSTLIQLYNLDDENRVYFPDVEVAENGIFINRELYDPINNPYAWHKVNNLNDQDLGSKVFKFGYDTDRGYPYIEFPRDIADLIGEGLQISYIVSSGSAGKVLNGKLTKIASIKITSDSNSTESILTSLDSSKYILANSTSFAGENPETLNQAYINFKKTIGTFNTLVSCRDYSNYINLYKDTENNKLVSSVQVTDLRTDPAYSHIIFTRNSSSYSYYKNNILTDNGFYNLVFHGTQPVNYSIDNIINYNKTYADLSELEINNIENALDDVKTINHNLTLPADGAINFIEADYTLKANIVTKYKVNTSEQNQIINNIKLALYNTFNASKLDFGYEIPYENLLECIQNADTRIKNINLDEPILNYYLRKQNVRSKELYVPYKDNTLSNIAKANMLAGALPIYGSTNSFNFDYLQKDMNKQNNLAGIYCQVNVPSITKTPYPLKKNESIQILCDSYKTDLIYPVGINYCFISQNVAPNVIVVKKNQTYVIKENEALYIVYTDSSDNIQFVKYEAGTTIKPNFDIVNTKGSAEITNTAAQVSAKVASKYVNWANKQVIPELNLSTYNALSAADKNKITPLFGIGSSEEIDMLSKNEVLLDRFSEAFWYVKPRIVKSGNNYSINNEHGDLILKVNPWNSNEYYYILEENEYFIYPNEDATSLNVLQAGTKLVCKKESTDTANTLVITRQKNTDIISFDNLQNNIADEDLGTFKKAFTWEKLPREFTVRETAMSNYADITITSLNIPTSLGMEWLKCPAEFSFTNNNNATTIDFDISANSPEQPLMRSVLSLYSNKDNPQQCFENQNIIYIYANKEKDDIDSLATLTPSSPLSVGTYIQTYPQIDSYNDLIVLQTIQYNTSSDNISVVTDEQGNYLHNYFYSIVTYQEYTQPSTIKNSVTNLLLFLKQRNNLVTNDRDEYIVTSAQLQDFFKSIGDTSKKLIISPNLENIYYNIFDSGTNNTYFYKATKTGTAYKNIVVDVASILSDESATLYISKPQELSLYNYLNGTIPEDAIINALSSYTNFDWLGERNTSKIISSYDPLYSFFDPNNVYNKLTIAKIDFDTSKFNIVGSSKL